MKINKIKKVLKKLLGCTKKEEELRNKISKYKETLGEVEGEVSSLRNSLEDAEKLVEKQKGKISDLRDVDFDVEKFKDYYMMPHRQGKWTYNMRGEGRRPVQLFFRELEDEGVIRREAKDFVEKGGLRSRDKGVDYIVDKAYREVVEEWDWDYVSDQEKYGKPEYWEDPSIAIVEKEGDCDSKAGAMHMFIKHVLEETGYGDSTWRIRFVASKTHSEPHAYNVWLASDGEWYVVESTLDQKGSFKRAWMNTPLRHNNFYFDYYGFATSSDTWWGSRGVIKPYEEEENRGGVEG